MAGKGKGGFIISTLKGPVTASELIYSKEYEDFDKLWHDPHVILGHTRWATQGNVNAKNAHPFKHGKIVMAHNGSIINKDYVSGDRKFEVDSEAICYSLDKNGLKPTLDKINGAYVLTYYNTEERSFNIIRNDRRPFHFCKHEKRNTWYYASEESLLYWILERNNISIGNIYELPVHNHLKWRKPYGAKEEFTVEELKINTYFSGNQSLWENDDSSSGGACSWSARGTAASNDKPSIPEQISMGKERANKGESSTNKVVNINDAKAEKEKSESAALRALIVEEFRSKFTVENGRIISFWLGEFKESNPATKIGYAIGSLLGDAPDLPKVLVKAWPINTKQFRSGKGSFRRGEYKGNIRNIWYDENEKSVIIGVGDVSDYVPGVDKVSSVSVRETDEKEDDKRPGNKKKDKTGESLSKVIGPGGQFITPVEFFKFVKSGCYFCKAVIPITDAPVISWYEKGEEAEGICKKCTEEMELTLQDLNNTSYLH